MFKCTCGCKITVEKTTIVKCPNCKRNWAIFTKMNEFESIDYRVD
jgi:hypothetical protein